MEPVCVAGRITGGSAAVLKLPKIIPLFSVGLIDKCFHPSYLGDAQSESK